MQILSKTIQATAEGVVASVQFAASNAGVYQSLSSQSSGVSADFASLLTQNPASSDYEAKFVKAACTTVNLAMTVGQADLFRVSQMLQTMAGVTPTTPYLKIPAGPADIPGAAQQDRNWGFFSNPWDLSAFQQLFNATGTATYKPFLASAIDRFNGFIGEEVCRKTATGIPSQRFVIRKVLPASDLKSLGRSDFNIGLDDLVLGGETAVPNMSLAFSTSNSGTTYSLSPPVVLATGYQGCFGSSVTTPCGTGLTRQPIGLPNQQVGQVSVVSLTPEVANTECLEGVVESSGYPLRTSSPADSRVAATCAVSVSAPRRISPLQYVSDTTLDGAVQTFVDNPFCLSNPDVAFFGVRGIPVLGVWSLTSDQLNGDAVATELRSSTPTPVTQPSSDWQTAATGLNGIEVWFFVAAETRPSSRLPAYELTTPAQ